MKKSIRDVQVAGKRVLMRCDFNVPVQDGVIGDDNRILESLPSIRYLMERGAKLILCSHLGRPKGGPEPNYSLAPVAQRLSELLNCPVPLAGDCIGEQAEAAVAVLQDGDVCLLENLRFHAEEEQNDPGFAKQLASLAELYVNDAFGTAHRAHASTAGVADYLPAVCGFLIEKELRVMGGILEAPEHPFVAVLGGNKVSDKIGVVENLIDKVDALVIGGGMAFTFLSAMGGSIGGSICETDYQSHAMEILNTARRKGVEVYLPSDVFCGASLKDETAEVYPADDIPADLLGLDIGPETILVFTEVLRGAKAVLWNGPMGVFENPAFAQGTRAVADALAQSEGVSVVGGGDTAAAARQFGFADRITHISTGGGASLEYLEGRTLPGIACLQDE